MKSRKNLCSAIACSLTMLWGCSTPQPPVQVSPLVVSECKPPLTHLEGNTMGDLLEWAVYAAGRFNRCRAAALQSGD